MKDIISLLIFSGVATNLNPILANRQSKMHQHPTVLREMRTLGFVLTQTA